MLDPDGPVASWNKAAEEITRRNFEIFYADADRIGIS
jgi:hypothetical protein